VLVDYIPVITYIKTFYSVYISFDEIMLRPTLLSQEENDYSNQELISRDKSCEKFVYLSLHKY